MAPGVVMLKRKKKWARGILAICGVAVTILISASDTNPISMSRGVRRP